MAKILLYDEYNPEDIAMMQALYSRSAESADVHASKVEKSGSGRFMERFYVGYGHLSIADCGSTTLFIEGVSMLVAKAIQDWPLYAGQETSTRYIDMQKQAVYDPLKTKTSQVILQAWMDFYISSGPELEVFLKQKYPLKEGENEVVYTKAIKARSFDILRGFLPAGITTQLSWHTNLRQAWDKLSLLRHHPLEEVRTITEQMLAKLQGKYSHSFSHPHYEEQERYRADILKGYTYFHPKSFPKRFSGKASFQKKELRQYKDILRSRPIKTNLPFFLRSLGTATFDFLLDFGSFRDLQRHRASISQMPLLTTEYGFHPWYLEQLPEKLRKKAERLIAKQTGAIQKLRCSPEEKQYFTAMGFRVPCRYTFDLPALVYFIELRSGTTVHATLREITHAMHRYMQKEYKEIKLHTDLALDDWDIRRGLHDIIKK